MLALLSPLCKYTLSFPIKYSAKTVDFPKIRTITLTNGIVLEVYKTIKHRINQQRTSITNIAEDSLPRLNYERRFEFFHFIQDLLTMITDCKLVDYTEEHTGISGNFSITYPTGVLSKEDIMRIGKEVLEKLYGNRGKNEKLRTIEMNSLTTLLPENICIVHDDISSDERSGTDDSRSKSDNKMEEETIHIHSINTLNSNTIDTNNNNNNNDNKRNTTSFFSTLSPHEIMIIDDDTESEESD